tara:strand:+ start:350 stop:862 length:513 start_codon:yes stop_codon:yes gene_type:complete
MKPDVQRILTKLAKEKVELFTISEAKNILKDDFQDKVNAHNKIFVSNVNDLKSFQKKSIGAIRQLEIEQQKSLDNLQKEQKQQLGKYVKTLSNELKEAKSTIKIINKKIQKHKSTLKEFKQELKELGIKESSSKLYEEIDSAVFLMGKDKERLEKSIDFIENTYEYTSNI